MVRGFTLIEMMVTIVVLVVLLSIAAPSFQKIIANQRIKSASFDLFSALTFARSEAMKRNIAPPDTISVRAGATTDGAWTTGWRVVFFNSASATTTILRSWGAVPSLSINEPSNITLVGFGRVGRLTTCGPSIQINTTSASFNGLVPRCIKVDLSGRPGTQTGNCS
jgi:type IV fimbrial biogenesis protein FimT